MTAMDPRMARLREMVRDGVMSEQDAAKERAEILEDIAPTFIAPTVGPAPAPSMPTLEIRSEADRRREAERLRLAKASTTQVRDYKPRPGMGPVRIPRSVTDVDDSGETIRRIMSEDEVQAAFARELAKMTPLAAAIPSAPVALPKGQAVVRGVLRPMPKSVVTVSNPEIEAIRARWKSGEFGSGKAALDVARELIAQIKGEIPTASRVPCRVCHGKYGPHDKGTGLEGIGKQCLCEGKGYLTVDTSAAVLRAQRGSNTADPLPENPDSVCYIAYLTDGRTTTIHGDSGPKALRGACQSLRESARGFLRVVFPDGCLLVLRDYETTCPACWGKGCGACDKGKVEKRGARFYFPNEEERTGAQAAHEAGLLALTGFDPDRQCGRKKCKGSDCYACKAAQKGGYQRPGYLRCPDCQGTKFKDGEPCGRCRSKGYLMTTEFYWSESFEVSPEVSRVALLEEDRPAKRDRHIAVKIGTDTVLVGAGKIPSRKSGAIQHLQGTARNKYDRASSSPDGLGVWRREPGTTHVTFSGG